MASLNRALVMGNVGRDPELRYTPGGAAVCTLRVATTRPRKGGERRPEDTEWHSIVLFDKQAEVASKYLKKGNPVYIEGYLRTRKWTDKQGVERFSTEIVATDMQMMGSGQRAEKEQSAAGEQQAAGEQATQEQAAVTERADDPVEMQDPPF